MPQQLPARDAGLDVVRAIAAVMVVATHAASAALYLPVGSANWFGALLWGGWSGRLSRCFSCAAAR